MNKTNHSRAALLEKIQEFLSEIVDEPNLVLLESSSAEDVLDWDSVTHVKLILMLEAEMKIRFTPSEMNSMNEVADIITLVQNKF